MAIIDLESQFKRSAGLFALIHLAVYVTLNVIAAVLMARAGGDAIPFILVIAYGILGTPLMHVLEFGFPGLSLLIGDGVAVIIAAILNSAIWGFCLAFIFRRVARRQRATSTTQL